jgi:hypothetical protein
MTVGGQDVDHLGADQPGGADQHDLPGTDPHMDF